MLAVNAEIVLAQRHFHYQIATKSESQCIGIVGESGCGKSTLFKIIAGFAPEATGSIQVKDKVLQDANVWLTPQQRNIGYVFQNARLFPHLNVEQNLVFAYKRSTQRMFSFEQVVSTMQLKPLLARKTHFLSGGEQQRVAIARAILSSPQLLLLDEPLTGIDKNQKLQLLDYLKQIKQEYTIPMLMISHNHDELCQLAEEIINID
ncbi:ATP-binding cassette domain-containing protein [Pseudoalteromonas sp.]|uniref:ATP-binding cassette domain-containing protein n=1 Tax=Pseudoalteromonas sp. TaxID=53249 RepID=UPI003563B68E